MNAAPHTRPDLLVCEYIRMFRHNRLGSERFLSILTPFAWIPKLRSRLTIGAFAQCEYPHRQLHSPRPEHPSQTTTGMTIKIPIHRGCDAVKIKRRTLVEAIESIASDFGWSEGHISLAIVDDAEIHRVNREFLQHDYPTDVISFDTTESDALLEGEIVVSAEMAKRVAQENGWNPEHELLLYVVHGMLHIVGLNDKTSSETKKMRRAEREYMERLVGDPNIGQVESSDG